MFNVNDLTLVANCDQENVQILQKTHENQMKKIYKLELIVKMLQNMPNKQQFQTPPPLKCPAIIQNVTKIISTTLINNKNTNLLGLDIIDGIDLPYTERKEIRNYIIEQIPVECLPAIQLTEKIQKQFPNTKKIQNEIFTTEKKRQRLNSSLIKLKQKKCDLMKVCLDLKLSSYSKNELQLMYCNYKLNQSKSIFLQNILINQMCNRTEHAMKAIRDVTKFIDRELEEKSIQE